MELPPLPASAQSAFEEYRDWFLEAKPVKYFFFRKDERYPEEGLPEDSNFIATLVESDWGQNILGGKRVMSWGTAGFYVCATPQEESLEIDASHEIDCGECNGDGFDQDENMCPNCNGSGNNYLYFQAYLEAEGHIVPRC